MFFAIVFNDKTRLESHFECHKTILINAAINVTLSVKSTMEFVNEYLGSAAAQESLN